mgnify:CR=1 FL=1
MLPVQSQIQRMKREFGLPEYSCAGILLAWMITYDPMDVTWHSLVAFTAALAYVPYNVGQRLWRVIRRPQEDAKKRNGK